MAYNALCDLADDVNRLLSSGAYPSSVGTYPRCIISQYDSVILYSALK